MRVVGVNTSGSGRSESIGWCGHSVDRWAGEYSVVVVLVSSLAVNTKTGVVSYRSGPLESGTVTLALYC